MGGEQGRGLTRRALGGALLASPVAAALAGHPGTAFAAEAPFTPGAIDVHHHFLPPGYKPLARPWLDRFATGVAGVLAWTPERSLAAMDAAGVTHAILSISAPGIAFGPAGGSTVARDCNDYAAALAQAHPDRFSFFAALPLPDVAGAIAEADRALGLPGARGVGLLTNYDGRYLGDPAFRPLFAALAARGTAVFVHPTTAPCCTGLTPDVPTPLIEFPVDTGRAIASLLWAGVLSAYPGLRFVFSHGGGILPMVLERVASVGFMRPDLAARVPEGPLAALRRLFVDTASVTNAPAMAAIRAWLPPGQILFGTDFPWGDPARTRRGLQALDLPADRLAAILASNARAALALG